MDASFAEEALKLEFLERKLLHGLDEEGFLARRYQLRHVAQSVRRRIRRLESRQGRALQSSFGVMPFRANSFFAFSFLAKCASPIPRSTLGALLNWMFS